MIKYDNVSFDKETYTANINKIINQVYKLLPMREENKNWIPTMKNIIVELTGMNSIMISQKYLFSVLCKLEGLLSLNERDDCDFILFRSTIFDCLNLLSKLKDEWVE